MKRYAFNILMAINFNLLCACSMLPARDVGEIWIDVRTPAEHAADAIPGHYNIEHTIIGSRISGMHVDKDTPIYLYCGSGRRAGIAEQTLENMGYTHVSNAGSIEDVRKNMAQ